MRLLRFVLRASGAEFVLAVLVGALAGLANAGLVVAIHRGLENQSFLGAFAAACAVLVLGAFVGRTLTARVALRAVRSVRIDLVESMLALPFRKLEEVGAPALETVVTEDVLMVSQAVPFMAVVALDLMTILGAVGYLVYLSWRMFLIVLAFALAAIALSALMTRGTVKTLHAARDATGVLHRHLHDSIRGNKELKLNATLRRLFLDRDLVPATREVERLQVKAEMQVAAGTSVMRLLGVSMIALTLAIGHDVTGVTDAVRSGFALGVLFAMGPFEAIQSFVPIAGRADVALTRIQQIGIDLKAARERATAVAAPEATEPPAIELSVRLEGVTHTYRSDRDDSTFTLGPVDALVRPGHVLFVVGGNGSGKSTLIKLLVGLYRPEEGAIYVDGKRVVDADIGAYRQHFSAVLADYHLFEALVLDDDARARAKELLEELHLAHKVAIENDRFTTVDLSSGQRKRLALLRALFEDRPVYVFDEWASDQDPFFRHWFYTKLVPSLRERGKAVVAVTHDEAYFDVADDLLKLSEGKMVTESTANFMTRIKSIVPPPAAAPSSDD